MCDSTECVVETLDVSMIYFLVVPWWMVFHKIIDKVEFFLRPYKIKFFLSYTIFHPPVPHVMRFETFLAHF